MEQNCDKTAHTVFIDNKKSIEITAVKEVAAFTEREICLRLLNGESLVITGQNLKITGFTENCGKFTACGVFESVKYRSGLNVIKRMFK